MCNLYVITANQEAISHLFHVMILTTPEEYDVWMRAARRAGRSEGATAAVAGLMAVGHGEAKEDALQIAS